MKFKMPVFLITILFSFSCLAQRPSPTTDEEYNYCVRGYQTMISSGLDMKKGYVFENLFDVKDGNYSFTAKLLLREQKKEVAAIMIITKSAISGRTYYHCLPHDNNQLLNAYFSDLGDWDKSLLFSFTKVMTGNFGSLVPESVEMQKKIKK